MRATVLGCGGSSGVPQIGGRDGRGDWGECDPAEPRNRRTRAAALIELAPGFRLLVDTGPDLREQLLACAVPSVDAIVFTHGHADHVCGIDDVRGLNRAAGRPIDTFALPEVLDELASRFGYVFGPWTPPAFYRPVLVPHVVEPRVRCEIGGVAVEFFAQAHGRIRTLGIRTGWFAYSTDLSTLDEAALAALAGVDTWVVDCFQREPHIGHAHLERVVEWARDLRIRRTVLTHMGTDLDWAWMRDNLPDGVEPAFDGQVIERGQRARRRIEAEHPRAAGNMS